MKITLHYFSQLRQLADKETEEVDAAAGTPIESILQQAADKYEASFRNAILKEDGTLRPSLMLLINEEPVSRSAPAQLKDGDQIKLITPIAGG